MGKLKIKYGTFANYIALASKDPDTLYFITDTDRGGLVYRGAKLVTEKIKVEQTGDGDQQVLTVTDYSTATPSVYTVRSSAAIAAIVNGINGCMANHRTIDSTGEVYADGKAGATGYGHVRLSDATDGTELAESGGTAATPKAVKDALDAAKAYADTLVGGLSGAMVFKGTLGMGGTVSRLPGTYSIGDTYRVIEAGIYAGHACEVGDMVIAVAYTQQDSDWTVAQNNIDGAVTAERDLEEGTLILGAGHKTVDRLPAGTDGYWLRQTERGPRWIKLTNLMLGQGHGTCATAAATTAKVGAMSGFELVDGALVSLRFTYANTKASATLNVNSTGAKPIFWRGAAITADYVIEAGDTVTFMYDGTRYHIIAIDRPIDASLSATSRNAVRNSAVKAALDLKQGILTPGNGVAIDTVGGVDDTIHLDYGDVDPSNTTKPVTGGAIRSAIDGAALAWEQIPSPAK